MVVVSEFVPRLHVIVMYSDVSEHDNTTLQTEQHTQTANGFDEHTSHTFIKLVILTIAKLNL